MNEDFLCIKHEKKRLYQAVYSSETGNISLSDLWTPVLDSTLVSRLKFEYCPAAVLICNSCSDLTKSLFSELNPIFIPKSDFLYDACKVLVIEKCFKNSEIQAVTSLDFSNKELISCCGALVKFLMTSHMNILGVKYFSPCRLSIDFNTLLALQVIKEDSHPSNIKNIGKSKEGLSILALLDTTVTPQGRKKLKSLLLNPYKDLKLIEDRLASIGFFLQNFNLTCEILKDLKYVYDLEVIIKRISEAKSLSTDWKKLQTTIKSILKVHGILKLLESVPSLIYEFMTIPLDPLHSLLGILEHCVDFSHDTPKINSGVSEELDFLTQTCEEIERVISQIVKSEKAQLSTLQFSKLTVIFMQGIGYLLEFFFETGEFPEEFDTQNYSFQFSTDNCLYFRTTKTVALDEKFGDIQSKTKDLENSLLLKIESEILSYSSILISLSQILADFDTLLALVVFAETYKLTKPYMVPTSRVQIVNGRHLLVELCCSNCIPNDCALDEVHKIGVITGPNFSGKSIYLKTVGLIVYLAHIGSYVPAEIAEIGVLDNIFSRISSDDNKALSSFTKEIMQISIALNNSNEKSLMIIDEFGKNTQYADGLCLFVSLVKELELNSQACALLTTHYIEAFTMDLLTETEYTKFYTMEIARVDTPVFLYKLIRGVSLSSMALWCAKLAGISEDIIDRAQHLQNIISDPIVFAKHSSGCKAKIDKLWDIIQKFGSNDDISRFVKLFLEAADGLS